MHCAYDIDTVVRMISVIDTLHATVTMNDTVLRTLILTYTVRAMCYPPALSLSVLKVIPFYPITIGTSASRGAINVADISVQ